MDFPRRPDRYEARGTVRYYRWEHAGREPILMIVESAGLGRHREVQLVFGHQFGFQRSGFHGSFERFNSTTLFINDVRHLGANARWSHRFTFLLDTDFVDTWRCVSFPIMITQLPPSMPRAVRDIISSDSQEAVQTAEFQRAFMRFVLSDANDISEPGSSASPVSTSEANTSSASSSSSQTGSSSSLARTGNSSASTRPMTWQDYVKSLSLG